MHVPLLLTDFLDRSVELYGEKPAIIDDERILTYRQLNGRVNQLSRGLRSLGVKKGDKVAYLAPNTTEMLEGFYGVFQVGAVMTALNTRLQPADYQFILTHSESKVLFVDEELYPLIKPVLRNIPSLEKVIIHGEAVDNREGYDEWRTQFSPDTFDRAELEETDIASLLYTSGTTGNPKGVLLSHRANYLHALSSMHHLRVSDSDTLLHVLPMFHVNGWGSPFYYTMNGATQVMLRKVDPKLILQKVKDNGVTVMHMAPTVLNMVIEEYESLPLELEQDLRVVIAGSAPPPAFVRKVEEDLKWEFIQVYGMTEISPLITTSIPRSMELDLPLEDQYLLKAKTGYSMVGSKVRVLDEMGDEVSHDGKTIGEIATRSNNVMEGYYKNETATNKTIRDGWLYTGDMAVVDHHGYIEIVDRKKDVIISGGENISSIEVEGTLYDHPAILEAAVVAVPDEKWGEVPHAVIVLREGYAEKEADLIDYCRKKLAHFKVPKSFSFVNQLPKTASGKIQKVVLRKKFWKGHDRMVR
ncbi:long-chain-fatty-acid--CoA ligase [Halobacillus naozhouensis]|uniref:Long-chain-fatty-acid--CoA ligase n=1 Tax=Halobacillus naozhouensis TaxID=554880 RepID=A0ABY8IZ06_9BACI|nr:long-chain-fatty-acid--CoA ligase [Halobacillus naozhouensis]WFT75450.1 long-chain-fatty-acid--CoA ligase [Halobacillus naozhouensis]